MPHPEDTHTDHRGVSAFSQLAIALYSARSGAYPTVLGYLIHYRGYPLPRGIQFDQPILPPTSLSRDREGWVTYLLESEERQRKYAALKLFVTQQRLSGAYLSSFARANEVFFKLPPIELNTLDYAAQDTLREGFRPEATLLEPERETFSRYLTASGDLVAWHALRLPNQVCFGAETRGPYSEAILYRILAKLPDGTTLRVHSTDDAFVRFAGSFGACFNLEALGDPEVIGFSAETWNGLLLDRTAWRFFIIAARGPD